MITQVTKPNKDKLKLSDVSISTVNLAPDQAQRKINIAQNMPTVYYYGVELVAQNINKLIIDNNKFMPLCYVSYSDSYSLLHDIGFPADDAKVTIVIPSNDPSLGNIFMEFKIQKYEVETIRNSEIKKIHMWGICNVNNLLICEYKSYTSNSFDLFNTVAQNSGLGLMSNVDTSSDTMTWINPSMNNYMFLQDVTKKAWCGESSFVWTFLDLFYNINYVDVEKCLSDNIDNIAWVNTNILDNKLIPNTTASDKIISPILSNEPANRGSNIFFTSEKILNQSTDISLKRGYKRNAYFYDIDGNWADKAGAYKIYGLDTITSLGPTNNAIILKGAPGELDFFNANNVNHYMDKIDTKNMYPDFLWAKLQNKENIHDLQKIIMKITLPIPNFNIKRYEKLELMFTNKNIGIKASQKNVKLNGEWLVLGISYHFNGSTIWQEVTICKRELTIADI